MIVIVELRQGTVLDDSAILPSLFSMDWTPILEAQDWIVVLLLDEKTYH
jgi:hypothetical protein